MAAIGRLTLPAKSMMSREKLVPFAHKSGQVRICVILKTGLEKPDGKEQPRGPFISSVDLMPPKPVLLGRDLARDPRK